MDMLQEGYTQLAGEQVLQRDARRLYPLIAIGSTEYRFRHSG